MKKLISIISLFLANVVLSQTSSVIIKYDSIKIVTPYDTTKMKVENYFYFNRCSFVLISESSRIYDILIPAVHSFDATGIRILQDTGQKLEDGAIIYESEIHKRQIAIYFYDEMKKIKILKKDKTGIIFY